MYTPKPNEETRVEVMHGLIRSHPLGTWTLLGAIVGVEIPIERLVGQRKTSQNRSNADKAWVVTGLRASGDDEAEAMADLVAQYTETR
jgi:predicted FMN-binding regulatory protein PaiB